MLSLTDKTVFIQGKLSGMTRRKAAVLVRKAGGKTASRLDDSVNIVVFGEHDLPQLDFNEQTREMFEQGKLETFTEHEFFAFTETPENDAVSLRSLYTPAMLAELVKVGPNMIRLWERRGWLLMKTRVGKLPYFDQSETIVAGRLAKLHKNGVSIEGIVRRLEALKSQFPQVQRPLADLKLSIHGKRIEMLKNGFPVDVVGQKLFVFDEEPEEVSGNVPETCLERALEPFSLLPDDEYPTDKESLCELAVRFEELGRPTESLDCYRAALAAGGPDAVSCFQMAGLLYQLGEPQAARERYLMAIELDEDFVEARANLGSLFLELGELELAVSAFEGALDFHDGYADVHYHLGMTLLQLGKTDEAKGHLQTFLDLAPNSPWADRVQDILTKDILTKDIPANR